MKSDFIAKWIIFDLDGTLADIEARRSLATKENGKINWGIPVPLAEEKRRGLGDTDAPLWMVYTLIILLSAVWFHYLYVIYMIIKIKIVDKELPISMERLE